MSSPMSAPSRTQLLTELDNEYQRVDKIWSELSGVNEISGLDQSHFQEVKQHIQTSRDALTKARAHMTKGQSG